jgi:hypothetical protein
MTGIKQAFDHTQGSTIPGHITFAGMGVPVNEIDAYYRINRKLWAG